MRLALLWSVVLGLAFQASVAFAQPHSEAEARPAPMKCEIGPAERYFDGVQWLVFACADGASVVFVTGPKSPKDLSFVFIVIKQDESYKIHGEGNGDKALTAPAFEAIKAMTTEQFETLHAEAYEAARAARASEAARAPGATGAKV